MTFSVPTLSKAEPATETRAVHGAASALCTKSFDKALPQLPPSQVLVLSNAFLPSDALWSGGARWVDCDLSIIALGSRVDSPRLSDLPADAGGLVRQAVLAQVDAFDFCVDDPQGMPAGGPKGAGAVYADCTGDPDWSLERTIGLTDDQAPGGAYPPPDVFEGQFTTYCFVDDGQKEYAYVPTRQQWDAGDKDMECWVTGWAG